MNRTLKFTFIIIAVVIIAFPLVYKIQYRPIQTWDESRNAVNAIEMLKTNDYLVRTYNGEYDSWETKPPLLIWLQVVSMKIFDANVFAIRLPSVIASLLTCLVILFFFGRYVNDLVSGLLSVFMLTTSPGFIGAHVARSGDHDALLVMFTTLIIFMSYLYFTSPDQNKNGKYLFLIWLFLTLAYFTKSSASFIILPGILLYAIFSKKIGLILKSKHFYLGMGFFVFALIAYYYLHERATPGYLKDVWQNEFFPRATNSAINYKYWDEPWYYYFLNLFTHRFQPWIYFTPLTLIVFFSHAAENKLKNLIFYLLVVAVCFLIIISSFTNNEWYDAPVLPALCILTATSTVYTAKLIAKRVNMKNGVKLLCISVFLIFCCFIFMDRISSISYDNSDEDTCYGQVLKNYEKLDKADSYIVYHTGIGQPARFYVEALQYKGFNISLTDDIESLKNANVIFSSKPDDIKLLHEKYSLIESDRKGMCYVYRRK